MKKILIIIAAVLMFSSNSYATIINLKCVDDLEKSTFFLVIDTKKEIATIGESTFELFKGEHHYQLSHIDKTLTDTFIINRITGGYNGRVFDKLWTIGNCFQDAKLKF